jgi:hypothetical protein
MTTLTVFGFSPIGQAMGRRSLSCMLLTVALLVAATPASARCPKRSSTHVLAHSGREVVYTLPHEKVVEGAGNIYACRYPRGRQLLINSEGEFGMNDAGAFTFAGHFLAYEDIVDSAAGPPAYILEVRNLQSGRFMAVVDVSSRDPSFSDDVVSLLLKPNGSVAWVAASGADDDYDDHKLYEVHVADRHGSRMLDQSRSIAPNSLRLSADHRSVTWLRGGAAQSAQIS